MMNKAKRARRHKHTAERWTLIVNYHTPSGIFKEVKRNIPSSEVYDLHDHLSGLESTLDISRVKQ